MSKNPKQQTIEETFLKKTMDKDRSTRASSRNKSPQTREHPDNLEGGNNDNPKNDNTEVSSGDEDETNLEARALKTKSTNNQHDETAGSSKQPPEPPTCVITDEKNNTTSPASLQDTQPIAPHNTQGAIVNHGSPNMLSAASYSALSGQSMSEGQLKSNTPNNDQQGEEQQRNNLYQDLTRQALLNRVEALNIQPPNPNETIDINRVRSDHLLLADIIPFTDEGELPPFQHGSLGLHYFQILRGVLSKHIRAAIHLEVLEENDRRHQIPRGLQINKNLNAVEPTYKLKLQHMQIMGKAEISMLHALIKHYQEILPKLMDDFTTLFNRCSVELEPVQKRLVVIKLLHYKNDLINEKKNTAFKKLSNQPQRRSEPPNPNDTSPQMGQLETNQYQGQPRQRSPQPHINTYRPRSQQRNQQRNWEDENPTESWQENPREQRQTKRRGRGRGRM